MSHFHVYVCERRTWMCTHSGIRLPCFPKEVVPTHDAASAEPDALSSQAITMSTRQHASAHADRLSSAQQPKRACCARAKASARAHARPTPTSQRQHAGERLSAQAKAQRAGERLSAQPSKQVPCTQAKGSARTGPLSRPQQPHPEAAETHGLQRHRRHLATTAPSPGRARCFAPASLCWLG